MGGKVMQSSTLPFTSDIVRPLVSQLERQRRSMEFGNLKRLSSPHEFSPIFFAALLQSPYDPQHSSCGLHAFDDRNSNSSRRATYSPSGVTVGLSNRMV